MPELAVNEVLHAPVRLNIMAALASIGPGDRISYTRLQEILEVTSGNLTSHLRKLEEAGDIHQEKRFVKRSPVTELRISKRGTREFDAYVQQLRGFLDGVEESRTQHAPLIVSALIAMLDGRVYLTC